MYHGCYPGWNVIHKNEYENNMKINVIDVSVKKNTYRIHINLQHCVELFPFVALLGHVFAFQYYSHLPNWNKPFWRSCLTDLITSDLEETEEL